MQTKNIFIQTLLAQQPTHLMTGIQNKSVFVLLRNTKCYAVKYLIIISNLRIYFIVTVKINKLNMAANYGVSVLR